MRRVSRPAFLTTALLLAAIALALYARPAAALEGGVPAQAAEMGPADRWDELSDAQKKKALERYKRFKELPPNRQRRIRKNYEKYKSLSPEEKARLKKRLERLKKLPPDKRRQLEERLERWRAMSSEERKKIRERVKRFQSLPPDKRESIKKRFRELRGLPPEVRSKRRRELREELRKLGVDPRERGRRPSGRDPAPRRGLYERRGRGMRPGPAGRDDDNGTGRDNRRRGPGPEYEQSSGADR